MGELANYRKAGREEQDWRGHEEKTISIPERDPFKAQP